MADRERAPNEQQQGIQYAKAPGPTVNESESTDTLQKLTLENTDHSPDIEAQDLSRVEKEASKKEIDPNLVTWDGPDDPENPKKWSFSKSGEQRELSLCSPSYLPCPRQWLHRVTTISQRISE